MSDRSGALWQVWARRRDEAAFRALVTPDLGRALGLARSLGCTLEDAEDALQESLARLAREPEPVPSRVGVRAFFFRAVRDAARSTVRAGGRRRRRERIAARPEAAPTPPQTVALREEVERALAALEPDDREAVRLRFLQDLEYREMAFVLETSEGACRVRVHRALERLRGALGAGAAAVLGSVVLPGPAHAAAMVESAVASAPTAAISATEGAWIMATGKKVLVGAAAAAAFTALGAVGATVLWSPGPPPAIPPRPGSESVAGGPVPGAEPAAHAPEERSPAAAATGAALADLSVGEEEWGFLREALVRERSRRETARLLPEDGGLDILRRVKEAGADPADLLWDFPRLRSHIRTGGETRRIDATGETTKVDLAQAAGDAAVVEFGPGRFEIESRNYEWGQFRKSRESLEIRGAGMDGTTLVFTGHTMLMVWEEQGLGNLVVRDLTLDGSGRAQLVDVRGSASAAFERVRFKNWVRAGHSAPVGVSGEALLACDGCEFVGGGQHSFGISVRGRVLALLRGCRFREMASTVIASGGDAEGSTVHFLDTAFEGSRAADSRIRHGKRNAFPVRVRGGTVWYGPPGIPEAKRREQWGEPFLAELEGVEFGPAVPACTVADLLSVAERVTPRVDETLVAVTWLGGDDGGARRFGVRFRHRTAEQERYAVYAADGTVLEEESRDPGGRFPLPTGEAIAECLPVAACVRKSPISLEAAANTLGYSKNTSGEPLVQIQTPDGWPSWALKARSGEVYAEWGAR